MQYKCKYGLEDQKGWLSDLSGISDFNSLPTDAKAYIVKMEELLKTRISIISTGPERSELIMR